MLSLFSHSCFKIDRHIGLVVIDIKDLDVTLRGILDQNFVSICEGNSNTDLSIVKKEVEHLFRRKEKKWVIGAIAEFFTHLILKIVGFKQECLFINLEENSIKKGFDGFYSRNGEEWIMESKAGIMTSTSLIYAPKISLAIQDLDKRVTGRKLNGAIINPWHNAYSHDCHCDVRTAKNIRQHIKKLSEEYTNGYYHSIDEFNNIPSATLFFEGCWRSVDHKQIFKDILAIKKKLKGKKVLVICMTQNSIDTFINYIKGF